MSSSLKFALCATLLLLIQLPAFSGQSVITIVDPPLVARMPSWVDVCLSNGYHKVTAKGFTGIVLTRESSTNTFFVLRSMALDAKTLELEAVNAISGIAIFLERLDTNTLDIQKMTAILHSLEGTYTTSEVLNEILTVSISEWSGESKEQKNLSFVFRQALIRGNNVRLRGQKELLNHILNMQDLVRAKSLPVSSSVIGNMLPACYSLKPHPIPGDSLSYSIVDVSSSKITGNITIASQKDIPVAIKKILSLRQK